MSEYILLMRENDHAWANYAKDEQQALLKKYFAWVDELKEAECLRGGNPISEEGALLQKVDGEIVDGPYTESKEVITGYFIITAESLAAAIEIAKGCPALAHGESIVVKRLGHD